MLWVRKQHRGCWPSFFPLAAAQASLASAQASASCASVGASVVFVQEHLNETWKSRALRLRTFRAGAQGLFAL